MTSTLREVVSFFRFHRPHCAKPTPSMKVMEHTGARGMACLACKYFILLGFK